MGSGRTAATIALLGVFLAAGIADAAPRRKPGTPSPAATGTAKPGEKSPVKPDEKAAGAATKSEQGFATLSHGSVPAKGRHDSILSVSRFGRYSVTANSAQGTAVQLVSRMIGPGAVEGTPGSENGRVDAFLDRGDYKIVAFSHEKGTGRATLKAHDYTERNPNPAMLVETKPVEGELDDFQQMSWWLEVKIRRVVALEAAGRNLADLRLWKDGDWLVDVEPVVDIANPSVGRPLAVRRINAQLEPGLYLVTAYGGKSQPWAEQGKQHPFYLRFGIPTFAVAGRERFEVSGFGYDRWLVPGAATYFRIELPEARPAQMRVMTWSDSNAYDLGGSTADVSKNSVPPVADLHVGSIADDGWHEVVITAPAGQPYTLQHFQQQWVYPFRGTGDYWVSTVHSGHPEDSVDATSILTEYAEHELPLQTSLVNIDSSHAWKRRFNLLSELTVFFEVKSRGQYQVDATGDGVDAKYRFEPFLTSRPPRYKSPEFRGSGSKWDLDAGYYVLTASPSKKGIVELSVHPVAGMFTWGQPGESAPTVLASSHFPKVSLVYNHSYQLYSNEQPGVVSGAVVRKLPLNLADALPVSQVPGEQLSFPFTTLEDGTLRAKNEDGSFLDVSVDGATAAKSVEVKPGEHTALVKIDAAAKQTVVYSIGLTPKRLAKDSPLPPLPDASKNLLPNFAVLTELKSQFFDLDRTAQGTFLVKAEKPDLFQLQTTGLLATAGALRTRTVPSFDKQQQNGVGRNFLIQQYLREGDYQVTVSALGQSKGHLGLELVRTRTIDAGELTDGVPARVSVPAGDAVLYRFTLKEAGTYRLASFGLGRTFRARLEDGDGWPLVAPNAPAEFDQYFDAGSYRLVVLPEPVATKQLTRLARNRDAPKYKGHGPHAIALQQCGGNIWTEPAGTEERVPDVWEFTAAAPFDARVTLSNEMTGTLFRIGDDGSKTEAAIIPPERGWSGPVAMGKYRLEARCVRQNNRVSYRVCVQPAQLVEGLSRDVSAPTDIPISVGRESLVELSSFGHEDVRAALFDSDGRMLARNDDRPDDWNFHLARKLSPGKYNLRVDPVGGSRASVTVAMNVPAEVAEAAIPLPAKMEIKPGTAQHLYPVTVAPGADLLLISARAQESVGVSIERKDGATWRSLGTHVGRNAHLEVPLAGGGGEIRLRVWSVDRRGNPITLRAASAIASKEDEGALERGLSLSAVPGFDVPLGAARVVLSRPGSFRLDGDFSRVRFTAGTDRPAETSPDGALVAPSNAIWVFSDLKDMKSSAKVRATRVVVSAADKEGVTLPVPQDGVLVCDLEKSKGPLVVVASSRSGQPGARLVEAPAATAAPDGTAMIAGTRSAISVALAPSRPAAIVWAAQRGEPIETRLNVFAFARPAVEKAGAGISSGTVSGARAFELPSGTHRLRIATASGTLAVLSKGDDVLAVEGGADDSLGLTVETAATRLTLLRLAEGPSPYEFEVMPLEKSDVIPSIGVASPFERAFPAAGVMRLAVAGESGATLHLRGGREGSVLVGADGSVQTGSEFAVPATGGVLQLVHGAGWVLAYSENATEAGRGLWGSAKIDRGSRVDPPSTIALKGAVQTLRLESKTPMVFHLRSATPLVSRVVRGNEKPVVELHAGGLALDEYLAGNGADITLRAVGGGALSGSVDVTSTAVTPIGEGAGPEALLAAGDTRFYSFQVPKQGPVGVGVRADSDAVDAILLDARGIRVATGVVQMPELAPGTYLLAIHVAESGSPTRVRPAIVGIKEPDTGPPDDVKRAFVSPDSDKTSFSATRLSAPPSMRGRVSDGGESDSESGDEGGDGETLRGRGGDDESGSGESEGSGSGNEDGSSGDEESGD